VPDAGDPVDAGDLLGAGDPLGPGVPPGDTVARAHPTISINVVANTAERFDLISGLLGRWSRTSPLHGPPTSRTEASFPWAAGRPTGSRATNG